MNRPWTDHQKAEALRLRDEEHLEIEDIAKRFGRTANSVTVMVSSLRVKARRDEQARAKEQAKRKLGKMKVGERIAARAKR